MQADEGTAGSSDMRSFGANSNVSLEESQQAEQDATTLLLCNWKEKRLQDRKKKKKRIVESKTKNLNDRTGVTSAILP